MSRRSRGGRCTQGKITHNFQILGKKSPTLAPGQTASITVELTKKGRYAFLCTLPGHAGAGMKGSFAIGVAPTTTGPEALVGDPAAGAAVFAANGCGSCHTLAAAGSTGTVGPNLDGLKPSQSVVKFTVQSGATAGGATMPQFNLSPTDLNNIAAYVYQSTHH